MFEWPQQVGANNYNEISVRTNRYDTICIDANNGKCGCQVHLEFSELHKINALINILMKARDEIFTREKETNG